MQPLTTIRKVLPPLALTALTLLLGLSCQSEPEKFTVGVISFSDRFDSVYDGFKAGMTELKYVEGRDIEYVFYRGVGDIQALDKGIQEVLAQDVDMVFSITTPASQKVGAVTAGTKIPVVFAPVVDPVGAGLVNSLSRPGGNVTGVRVGGFAAKELEWLVTLAPTTKRVLVPHNPKDAASVEAVSVLREAALKLGTELVVQEGHSPQELDQTFINFPEDVDAILLLPNNIALSRIADFVRVSHERHLPLASVAYAQLEAGALMTYGPDFFQAGRQAARLADKVLRGTSPAVLPVETSEYFFSINLPAAQAIGLTVSDEILHQADRVIR